ncbi:MAG: hypothetical protein M3388_02260 [Acidobacteriota bacterium]|nr:hypothetical protein [Acidobacteriota bacterium]
MGNHLLEKHFSQMGARAKVFKIAAPTWRQRPGIDIGMDKNGEFFDIKIAADDEVSYEVVDLNKNLRHLLLMARRSTGKEKFLCGHDERHWFVCAVPGKSITKVENAMEVLQPAFVRQQASRKINRHKNRLARRNEAFVRQGEWFFVPFPELDFKIDFLNQIHKNEPISRGGGSKAHFCAEVFRSRGKLVMVCSRYPSGVSMKRYNDIVKQNPKASRWNWRAMQINASVYARGTVRHPDHKTIHLDGWHQVFMNTENEAPGMRHVVFLD